MMDRRHFSMTAATTTTRQTPSLGRRAWLFYSSSLYKYPLRTKAIAAAVIFFSSDCATQYITQNKDESFCWDAPRSCSGAFFGVVASSWLHVWWGALEVFMEARIPAAKSRLGNAVAKVIVDQGVGAPFYIYSYYFSTNLLHTLSKSTKENQKSLLKSTHDKAVERLVPTMPRHWRIWPFVHTCTFYFVPLHHRVLVQNTFLVGWSGYLSHLNHGGLNEQDEVKGFD